MGQLLTRKPYPILISYVITAAALASVPVALAQGTETVNIEIFNWGFRPDLTQLPPGAYVINFTNTSDRTHGVWIPDLKINMVIPPGESAVLTLDLTPGTSISLFCSVPTCGSAAQHGGMTGTITAQSGPVKVAGLLLRQVEPAYWLIIGSAGAALFFASLLSRFYLWSRGRPTFRDELSSVSMWGLMRLSFKAAFSRDCFTARRLFDQSIFRGLHLVLIIWGTLMLFLGAVVIVLFQDLGFVQLEPLADLVSRIWLDLFGTLVMVGVIAAIVKRTLVKSVRQLTSMQDGVLILMFLVLLIQGFIVKGLYMQTGGVRPLDSSPVAWAFGQLLLAALQNPSQVGDILLATLMIHEFTAVLFVVYIPHSKMFHIFASPITTQIASRRYGGYAGNRESKAPGIIAEGKRR